MRMGIMPEESIEYEKVLREDLKAYLKALDAKEFGLCNIVSNRMMTNAMILNSVDFNLLGAILKEITFDFNLFQEENSLENALKKLKNTLKSYQSSNPKVDQILDDYYEYFDIFRNIITSPLEEYEENKDFSIYTTKFSINFFIQENENDLILPYNFDVRIYGVLNEINRVMKSFGFTKHQLVLKLVLSYFGRMYEYFRFLLSTENIDKIWEEKFSDYKEKLLSNVKSFSLEESYINNSLELLFEFCREWRTFFMRLLEIPRGPKVEKGTAIPSNVRQELDEMVTKLINSKLEEKED